MSGAGISPLAIYDPQLYAEQLAIQQRQALAQSLLQGGMQSPGSAPYAGLRNAANMLLGTYLARKSARDLGNLYNPQSSPQLSNLPSQAQPAAGPSQLQADTANLDPEGNPTFTRTPAPSQQPQISAQAADDGASALPPQAQRIYAQIPHIPGMPAQQALNFFLTNPTGYQAQWAKQFEQTDLEKNAYAAFGQGDPRAQAALQGNVIKGTTQAIRPGGGLVNFSNNSVITMPNQQGIQTQYPFGANGPAVNQLVPGAPEALSGAAAASGYGKATVTPGIGYDANNQPVATNQAQLLGYGPNAPQSPQNPLGIRSNNPGNLQPGGQEAQYGSRTEGILRASANLDAYARQGVNTVQGIVSRWAPPGGGNDTQAYVADVAGKLGVSPNQPLNVQDPRVKGALLEAIFSHENGPGPSRSAGLLPELPAGQAQYAQSQAKDAAERHDQTVQAASESPMRINVLDNIIGLSRQGVATGPGQEWQNSVLGYAANTPGLSKIMGGAKDNVARFQELQKFTYQNAIRSWQAAGGTGTDAQMESMAHANPNDHLFPQALQAIAQWGKAAELAVQGKANAQDRFLAQAGQTPSAQIKFESAWRNAFDPKVFQYSLMSPQEKQVFAAHELKTPAAARSFLAKQQQLQAMGALQ